MKTRNSTFLIFFLLLLGLPNQSFSQQEEQKPLRPFQISLFPVVGTDGASAMDYRYRVSVNIFAGITGGLQGIEGAGFANINLGPVKGIQGAGFANIVTGQVEGLQGAGFMNLNLGNHKGLAGAGFANIITGQGQGLLGAGFANIVTGHFQGLQGAGFMNLAANSKGLQGAGFMNIAENVHGLQAAGFMNVANDVQGLQAAGFLNVGQVIQGFQIGFINVADSIDGIPIGFLSIVKRGGYRSLEFATSDVMHLNVSAKIGVPHFYNIFTFSSRPFSENALSGFGYGVGTQLNLTHRAHLQIEAHSTGLRKWNEWHHQRRNQLSELRMLVGFSIAERLDLFAGPVLYNQLIREDSTGGFMGRSVAPYDFHTRYFRDYQSQWWIGARAGIRLILH